jgi:hypothetical protein
MVVAMALTSACWYLTGNTGCAWGRAFGSFEERSLGPARLRKRFARLVLAEERVCDDGRAGDEDCLTDQENPDCRE